MNKYTKRITKTVTVTITLTGDGRVSFGYLEPESGDDYRICSRLGRLEEEQPRVGSEILSWVSLMADELDERVEQEA